jgi:3-oxoacyl-[acyl-carrier-protein] synthase I
VPGEGSAAVVISANPSDRGWSLMGGAQLCDTHSISATNPDGSTIAEVIHRCVQASGVPIDEIAALKMHGTASLLNDEAEAAGLRRAFETAPKLCALNPLIGHTYGACGVVELALFCGLVGRGQLPATPGIADESDLDVVLSQTVQPQRPGKFMLNYFGFGGSNTSLIVANDA